MRVRRRWLATRAAIAAIAANVIRQASLQGMTVIMTPVNAPAVHRKTLKMEATRLYPNPHIHDTSLEKPYVLTVPYLKARSNACSKVRDVMITPRSRF
jgi:hypothetical protein